MLEQDQFIAAANAIYEAGCIKFGDYTLVSGAKSPFYIDLRRIRSFPSQKRTIVDTYIKLIEGLNFDVIADVPTAATPIVSSICDRLLVPQITPRMQDKVHGTGANIDGVFKEGDVALVIDDLITFATSKLSAIKVLENGRLKVVDVATLIDRQQGGRQELEAAGYRLHTGLIMPNLAEYYNQAGFITLEQFGIVINYLQRAA